MIESGFQRWGDGEKEYALVEKRRAAIFSPAVDLLKTAQPTPFIVILIKIAVGRYKSMAT